MTPVKPPYGSPCNRCGLCCMNELCPLGAAIFQRWDGPCPALLSIGEGYSCGLVLLPDRFAPVLAFQAGKEALGDAASILIGTGCGCDAQTNDEADNPEYHKRLRAVTPDQRRRVDAAARLWRLTT